MLTAAAHQIINARLPMNPGNTENLGNPCDADTPENRGRRGEPDRSDSSSKASSAMAAAPTLDTIVARKRIEVAKGPSAAIAGDLLAERSDFFSIGTNDLIQYLLAIDRGNSRIAHLYDPTHPAVVRTLKQIVDTGHAKGLKVSVCGEMAGDALYAPLLLGLGVDELSMTPTLVPSVRYIVRAMKMADARALAVEALKQTDARKTFALVEAFYDERMKGE